MKRLILVAFPLAIIVAISLYFIPKLLPKPESIHYHAGFQVYKDGKMQDFSNFKYMHILPCTDSEDKKHTEDEQEEKAHLHDNIGNVVHVHRKNVVWGDLFKNLNYSIDTTSSYINRKEIKNIQSYPIKPYDSLVLFIGKPVDQSIFLDKAVTKQYIQELEKKSENCGT